MSAVETAVNILIGFAVSLGSEVFIFPHYDIHVSFETNVHLMLFFTAVSIIRSYVLRRVFNSIRIKT